MVLRAATRLTNSRSRPTSACLAQTDPRSSATSPHISETIGHGLVFDSTPCDHFPASPCSVRFHPLSSQARQRVSVHLNSSFGLEDHGHPLIPPRTRAGSPRRLTT